MGPSEPHPRHTMTAPASHYDFELPVAFCYSCKKDVVVYRDHPEGAADADPLGTFCLECDAWLDRWGMVPEVRERDFAEVGGLGYVVVEEDRRACGGCASGGCARARGGEETAPPRLSRCRTPAPRDR